MQQQRTFTEAFYQQHDVRLLGEDELTHTLHAVRGHLGAVYVERHQLERLQAGRTGGFTHGLAAAAEPEREALGEDVGHEHDRQAEKREPPPLLQKRENEQHKKADYHPGQHELEHDRRHQRQQQGGGHLGYLGGLEADGAEGEPGAGSLDLDAQEDDRNQQHAHEYVRRRGDDLPQPGTDDEEDEEEDDEEDLVIEVEKPVFQARGKSKVRNLGYAGDTPKRVKKEIEAPAHIDVEKPAFEANKSSKVRNLGYSNQEPQKKVEKPVSKPIEVETPKFEASSKKKPTNYDEVIKKENRNWKVIDTYRVKPNVFKGERSLISKEDASEKALLSKTVEILQGISSIMVDDNCVFVPKVLDEESPKLKAMRNFKLDYFNILFSVTDSDDDIIKAVIVSKDLQDTFVIGFYPSPRIEVYSSIGVSLDDRARPYYSFEQLLKLTND